MASAVSPFCLWVTGWVTNGGKIFQYLQLFAEKWPFFGPQKCTVLVYVSPFAFSSIQLIISIQNFSQFSSSRAL